MPRDRPPRVGRDLGLAADVGSSAASEDDFGWRLHSVSHPPRAAGWSGFRTGYGSDTSERTGLTIALPAPPSVVKPGMHRSYSPAETAVAG